MGYLLSRVANPSLSVLGSGFDTSGVQLSKSDLTLAFTQFLTRGTDREAVSTSLVTLFDSNTGHSRTSAELVKHLYWLSHLNRTAMRNSSGSISSLVSKAEVASILGTLSTLNRMSTRVFLTTRRSSRLVVSSSKTAPMVSYAEAKEALDVLGHEGGQTSGLIKARRGNFYLSTSSADLARLLGGSLAFQAPVLVDQASIAR